MILFVIPSEREAFISNLEKEVDERGIQYFTANKDKDNPGEMIFEINNKTYFTSFDIEEDD